MKLAEHKGWLLELSHEQPPGIPGGARFYAWVSAPDRTVPGFGKAETELQAIAMAIDSAKDSIPAQTAHTIKVCGESILPVLHSWMATNA